MAGWAQLEFGTVSVGTYTYGDALPDPTVKDSEGGILTKGTHYTVSAKAYKAATCTTADEIATDKLEGGVTYYLLIEGKAGYTGQTAKPSFTVTKKNLTVTSTQVFTRGIGEAEPALDDDKVSVDGLAFGQAKAVLGELSYTYEGYNKPTYPGGEYAITFSYPDNKYYTFTYPTNKFTITGTDISGETVTVKEGTQFAKTYRGTAYTAADLTGLVLVFGDKELVQGTDFTIELTDAATPAADVNYTKTSANAYNAANVAGCIPTGFIPSSTSTPTLTEIQAVVAAAGDGVAMSEDQAYDYNATITGAKKTTDVETAAGSIPAYLNVGKYSYKVNFKGDYSGSQTDADKFAFTIAQAPLSVDVENITVTYKGAAYTDDFGTGVTPKLQYYGFAAADISKKQALIDAFTAPTVSVAQAGGATNASETGYALAIDLTGATTGAGSNYKFTTALNTGKLIIKKFDLPLIAKDAEKGPVDPDPETYTLKPYTMAAANEALDLKTITFTRANPDKNEVGQSYEITPVVTAAKVWKTVGETKTDVTANYNITAGTPKGKLTITKAALTITIKDQNKYYGDDDPATIANPVKGTNYIVTGLVEGDEITSITLKNTPWAEKGEVGNYVLEAEVTYTGAEHYGSFVVVPGNFEIKKAVLEATLPIKTVAKGSTIADTKALLTKDGIVITGWKDGETTAQQNAAYTTDLKATLAVDASSKLTDQTDAEGYSITLTETMSKKYTFVKLVGTTPTETNTLSGKLIVGSGDATALVLDDAATDNFTNIQAANGETKTVKIALNRAQTIGGAAHNWKKGIWNCMVLPFKTNARQISNALGYAIVNVVNPSETTEGNVKFKLEMLEDIPANTPIFVKTDNDFTGVAEFAKVQIEAPESAYPSILASSEAIGYKFVGAYTKKTITGNNEEHLRWRLGDNNAWNKIGNGSSATWDIVPFNAYMDLGATAGAREIVFTFEEIDGTTTSIRSIDIDNVGNAKVSANGWYTLGGVKLNGAPTQKGVYIQDGKKVVIK